MVIIIICILLGHMAVKPNSRSENLNATRSETLAESTKQRVIPGLCNQLAINT